MSQPPAYFEQARNEILAAKQGDIVAALHALQRQIELYRAEQNNQAWAAGRKGEGQAKIPGLTDTLATLLRRFAACGVVRYEDMPDLHRHKSALCKALKKMAPSVEITTLVGEGYELTAGFDEVMRLVRASGAQTMRAANLTPKQTTILRIIAQRGSLHVDQIDCLQRHVSNVRAKLKKLGLSKAINIVTHPGEGLYTLDDKGRETALRLISGELTPRKSERPKPKLITQDGEKIAANAA